MPERINPAKDTAKNVETERQRIVEENVRLLEEYIIVRPHQGKKLGVSLEAVHKVEHPREGEQVVNQLLVVFYDSAIGKICALPEAENHNGKYSLFRTLLVKKSLVGSRSVLMPNRKKEDFFMIRTQIPPEMFVHMDDGNQDKKYYPARIFTSSEEAESIKPSDVTSADRLLIQSLLEFNDRHKSDVAPEQELFSSVGRKAVVAQEKKTTKNREPHTHLEKMIKVVRQTLGK